MGDISRVYSNLISLGKYLRIFFLSAAALAAADGPAPRYLAFQIFTGGTYSHELGMNFPPPPQDLGKTVAGLRDKIGGVGSEVTRLGFVVGPLSFDQTDDQLRAAIASAFDVALETGVAVGFHVDDSMFWGRMKELNAIENIEWLDWNKTPNTGRELDWSATPKKIMPQLCVNSEAVKRAVSKRAALIGYEVSKGIAKLGAARRSELFLGVIAGWETQIGSDFDTGKYPGYCALTNAGFSAEKPPADVDVALSGIVHDFVRLWASSLVKSGVPNGKVYSHIAFRSAATYKPSAVPYLRLIHWTPPAVAFCDSCVAGFSTYPQPGHLTQWNVELQKHGNPPWASCEGTAADPGDVERSGGGADMEGYLGNLFNHGAVLVNVFGWGIGDSTNPFRRIAESDKALAAYRKFLGGETLKEAPQSSPTAGLPGKIQKIQAILPSWVEAHGPTDVKPLMEKLNAAIKAKRFDDADRLADEVLALIGK